MAKLTYKQSGVDRSAGDALVGSIASLVKKTQGSNVVSAIGGYASLYRLNSREYLAGATDGVGTKLRLAFDQNKHHTVGEDLVAMSVNDLLCVGARPLFFLDYFATGKLKPGIASKVIKGIAQGCLKAGCALVGGETAEMPGFYKNGEYDLGGFAVGIVDKKMVLPKKTIRKGDLLIGLPSSGFHSNGYSLLRKLLPSFKKDQKKLSQLLLTPTRIYVKSVLPLIEKNWIKGLSHITGSGMLNIPRMSNRVSYEIEIPKISELPVAMKKIFSLEKIEFSEMCRTFNMGFGMVLVIDPSKKNQVIKSLKRSGENPILCGSVIVNGRKGCRIRVKSDFYGTTEVKYE